jgi:cytidylate kinase
VTGQAPAGARAGTRTGDVVVAIDGPAGAGKSTVARGLAERLGLRYLDTGATYRAATLALLRRGVEVDDPDAVAHAVGGLELELRPVPGQPRTLRVWLDGEPPSAELRSPRVDAAVSAVSSVPAVRSHLVALQRAAMAGGGIVAEGRDVGSVVWPAADVKVFLTADPQERARRRGAEQGAAAGRALADRDRLDAGRAVSPVRPPPGARVVDSTGRPAAAVIDELAGLVRAARDRVGRR